MVPTKLHRLLQRHSALSGISLGSSSGVYTAPLEGGGAGEGEVVGLWGPAAEWAA